MIWGILLRSGQGFIKIAAVDRGPVACKVGIPFCCGDFEDPHIAGLLDHGDGCGLAVCANSNAHNTGRMSTDPEKIAEFQILNTVFSLFPETLLNLTGGIGVVIAAGPQRSGAAHGASPGRLIKNLASVVYGIQQGGRICHSTVISGRIQIPQNIGTFPEGGGIQNTAEGLTLAVIAGSRTAVGRIRTGCHDDRLNPLLPVLGGNTNQLHSVSGDGITVGIGDDAVDLASCSGLRHHIIIGVVCHTGFKPLSCTCISAIPLVFQVYALGFHRDTVLFT